MTRPSILDVVRVDHYFAEIPMIWIGIVPWCLSLCLGQSSVFTLKSTYLSSMLFFLLMRTTMKPPIQAIIYH